MVASGYSRGWKIISKGNLLEWFYEDTGLPYDEMRRCKQCGKQPTIDGHDACIANTDNVLSACCGHGGIQKPYIWNKDGEWLTES